MLTFSHNCHVVMLVCWYPESQTSTFQGFPLPFQALRQRRQPLRHGQLRPHGHAAQGGAGGLDVAAHGAAEGGENHWEVLGDQTAGGRGHRIQPPSHGGLLQKWPFEFIFRVRVVHFRWCIAPKGKSWKLEPVRFSKHLPYLAGISIPLAHPCVRQGLLKVSIGQILNVIQREAPNPARPKKNNVWSATILYRLQCQKFDEKIPKDIVKFGTCISGFKNGVILGIFVKFHGGTRYPTFGRIKGCQSNYWFFLTYQDTPPYVRTPIP